MTEKRDHYLEQVRLVSPDLEIERVELNSEGQNSDVLTLNGEWSFRFPKYAHVIEQMKSEVSLLTALKGRLPLAVPEPQYVSLEAPPGQAFMGYRHIPGEPLWRETFQAIRASVVVDHLADQLGAFLGALHGLTQADFHHLQLEASDSLAYYQDFYQRIQQKLFPLMRPEARQRAARHFENYMRNEAHFAYPPVLRHGDFGTSNLLYDPARRTLTGVLDFSGAALGDPAVDFAGLQISYGETLVKSIQRTVPLDEGTLRRVRFYIGTFALEEALFGYEHGDRAALGAGLAGYI